MNTFKRKFLGALLVLLVSPLAWSLSCVPPTGAPPPSTTPEQMQVFDRVLVSFFVGRGSSASDAVSLGYSVIEARRNKLRELQTAAGEPIPPTTGLYDAVEQTLWEGVVLSAMEGAQGGTEVALIDPSAAGGFGPPSSSNPLARRAALPMERSEQTIERAIASAWIVADSWRNKLRRFCP